jgi:hypothetical protein
MPDLLQRGSDWLDAHFKQSVSQTVEYWRGRESVEWKATPAPQRGEVDQQETFYFHTATELDFCGMAADLVIGGKVITPEVGDKIHWTLNGNTRVFEVLPTAGDEHFGYGDPYQSSLRVHAKEVTK